jgi:O-antigen ligase
MENYTTQKVNISNGSDSNFYYQLARIGFILFIFFIFFGTRIPFGEKATEVDELSSSNVVNQVVYGLLFITSLITLIPKWSEVRRLIVKEKIFTIFLIWCFLTIFWSNHPFISLKRYILYFTTVTVCISMLLYCKDFSEITKIFISLLGIYVGITILSIIFVPNAINHHGYWMGITQHKNVLGQIILLSLVLFVTTFKYLTTRYKIILGFLIFISAVIIFGTKSTTTLFTLIILCCISITMLIDKLFESLNIGRVVSVMTSVVAIIIIISVFLVIPELIESIVGTTGKDLTLTGRIDIWADIWKEVEKHFVMGTGFQGFWVVADDPRIEDLYKIYLDLPNQAHNGYLDILNEIGFIGLALFILLILNFFKNLKLIDGINIWKWFIIIAIITNLTESTFITSRSVISVMFIFSYFALFAELMWFRSVSDRTTNELSRVNWR